jgi:hypothetical protein
VRRLVEQDVDGLLAPLDGVAVPLPVDLALADEELAADADPHDLLVDEGPLLLGSSEPMMLVEEGGSDWGYVGAAPSFDAPRYLAFLIRGGVYPDHIRRVLDRGVEGYYQVRRKPKPDGGVRIIMKPFGLLKHIQRRIYRALLRDFETHAACHGYVRNRSIVTNALDHVGSTHMLALDLDSAFPSVTEERVSWLLQGKQILDLRLGKFSHQVEIGWYLANLIAELCTVTIPGFGSDRRLPQGTPTAPALFNLACSEMDERLGRFCERNGIAHSRFSDNMAFSRDEPFGIQELRIIDRIVERSGFLINQDKTRMMRISPGSVLRLPGVAISGGRVTIPRRRRRQLRAAIYQALRHGDGEKLNGLLAFAQQIYGEELPGHLAGALRPRQLTMEWD